MLAKVIGFGASRDIAARRAASALEDICLLGVNNNKLFLQNILRHPVFNAGAASTAFIEQHFAADPSMEQKQPDIETLGRAALLYYQRGQQDAANWSSAAANNAYLTLQFEDHQYALHLQETDAVFRIACEQQHVELQLLDIKRHSCVLLTNTLRQRCRFAFAADTLFLDDGRGHFRFDDITHRPVKNAGAGGSGELKASMDGAIVKVLVDPGDAVVRGQTMVVLEAMKMEHQLKAGIAGTVEAISIQPGQQVKARQLLATISPDPSEQE
jgi:geranyl-CoA carboxylase alpha subunit